MIATPYFELLYNQKNATHDIARHLIDARYNDTLKGESDELDITLEDADRNWMGTWYPAHGATLDFKIGYAGGDLLDCGRFEIDEITVTDMPNTVRIRALSAGVSSPLRTTRYRAFDGQTLDAIIGKVAGDLGYSVEGFIAPLAIKRVTQSETDLAFIKRLSMQYGYMVKVIGTRLVFSHLKQLKDNDSVLRLHRTEIGRGWEFREQVRTVKKASQVARQNPKTKELVTATKQAQDSTSPDMAVSRGNAESADVAQQKAEANLTQDNDPKATGRLPCEGDIRLIAGANVDLAGFERFDGKYLITTATHSIGRQLGYGTQIEFIRLEDA